MKTLAVALIASLIAVAMLMAGLGIKIILKRHGEFKRHCASADPYTGEHSGCVCGKSISKKCENSTKHSPLEVNDELLNELK